MHVQDHLDTRLTRFSCTLKLFKKLNHTVVSDIQQGVLFIYFCLHVKHFRNILFIKSFLASILLLFLVGSPLVNIEMYLCDLKCFYLLILIVILRILATLSTILENCMSDFKIVCFGIGCSSVCQCKFSHQTALLLETLLDCILLNEKTLCRFL